MTSLTPSGAGSVRTAPPHLESRWVSELSRHLSCGMHVAITGNTQDWAFFDGAFMDFRSALDQTLERLGYQARVYWNRVDGLRGQAPDRAGMSREPVEGAGAIDGIPNGGYQPPGAGSGHAHREVFDGARPCEPCDAVAAARDLLRREDQIAAFVMEFADLLTGPGEALAEEERDLLVHLTLTLNDAFRHQDGPTAGMRNGLILVASCADRLPGGLLEHPRLKLVTVTRPVAAEREQYFRQRYAAFSGAGQGDPDDHLVSEFVAYSDELTTEDLEAVRLLSHGKLLTVLRSRKLIEVYRHGELVDHWAALGPRLGAAREFLSSRVLGQEPAIGKIVAGLTRAVGGIHVDGARRPVRPKGILFLVGPTGVGKTELVKAIAEFVFGDPAALIRLDMSEYAEPHSTSGLTGAPPGYVGHEAGGYLTRAVGERPYSIILFDEIEKAHPTIWDKFLQILDDGRLTDSLGKTVLFDQTLLVFTSNVGALEPEKALDVPFQALEAHYRGAVREYFVKKLKRPELLGRIGEPNIIVYDVVRESLVAGIVDKFFGGLVESARERGISLGIDVSARVHMVSQCLRDAQIMALGGRGIKSEIVSEVETVINEEVVHNSPNKRVLRVAANGRGIEVFPDPARD